jgi:hypothetical protein
LEETPQETRIKVTQIKQFQQFQQQQIPQLQLMTKV